MKKLLIQLHSRFLWAFMHGPGYWFHVNSHSLLVFGWRRMRWRLRGSWEKIQEGGAGKLVAPPALAAVTSHWRARTAPGRPWKPLPPACFSQGWLQKDTCQIEPFIFPFRLGKEDCVCTLRIKINLIFLEKTTYVYSHGKNVIGTFWLGKIY